MFCRYVCYVRSPVLHLIFQISMTLWASAPVVAQTPLGEWRSPFRGSVPDGVATAAPIALTLPDAIRRGLSANLGAIESAEQVRLARAEWLARVSRLLPNVTGGISRTTEQLSVAALGFSSIPGFNLPRVIGPFSYADASVSLTQNVFNWADIKSTQSATAMRRASEQNYKASRELVVQAAANAYLLVTADAALVDATRAQVETAKALHAQVRDRHEAGLAAGIDELRARVELQNEQQRLIAAENQLAIDKLMLGRVIGLPAGQTIEIVDAAPDAATFAELAPLDVTEALRRAYASRPDYQGARSRMRAAELARSAAAAGYYPSASLLVNYGAIGPSFGRSNGTVTFVGSIAIPIFQGLTVPAQVLRADAELRQVRAQFDDLTGAIDEQVRTALLNLTSTSQLVAVARSSVDLATQTVTQARNRFQSGVADNLEVVQAQESLATANQSLIASLYSFNTAKVALAQAMGVAEDSALSYLGVK
jgi:outer membrane protein TolC